MVYLWFVLKVFLDKDSKVKNGEVFNFAETSESVTTFKIYRFDPSVNSNPRINTYIVDSNACGVTVLDALHYIRSEIDPTISFRQSCCEGSCGSCGMNINKMNSLACTKRMSDFKPGEKIEIYPLSYMIVTKDLVCNMDHFYEQYKSVSPWLQKDAFAITGSIGCGNPEGWGCGSINGIMNNKEKDMVESICESEESEQLQSPEERAKLDGLYDCIMCGCCSARCPSYWWNGKNFLGPAILLQAYRWVEDSRDTNAEKRLRFVRDQGHIEMCHTIFSCSTTCPKGLNPAGAIAELKKKIDLLT
jgi:succinate dehydrogenase / fumarate reductase iron-sulfur subunit